MASPRLGSLALLFLAGCAPPSASDHRAAGDTGGKADDGATVRADRVAAHFEELREDRAALEGFLRAMPKGADLHSHLAGAVPAAPLFAWGAADGLCVDGEGTVVAAPCGEGATAMSGIAEGSEDYGRVLRAWTMEGQENHAVLDRHQHFFDTFNRFGRITFTRKPSMLAEIRRNAGAQNIQYVELMVTLGSNKGGRIAEDTLNAAATWDDAFLADAKAAVVAAEGFAGAVTRASRDLEAWERDADVILGCQSTTPDAGCSVEVRYLVQAYRSETREYVLGQFLFAYEVAQKDARVVGLNLVQAEEDADSLAHVDDEMDALATLRRLYADGPIVHVALHAGELIPELLPAGEGGQAHLGAHIRKAVEIAGAERIGHGADLRWDPNPEGLMALMRERGVTLEACLTSNDHLLGVRGAEHPLWTYIDFGVSVALATDDEGILGGNLSTEFLRAAVEHDLDYNGLKELARASLARAFLEGAGLAAEPACLAEPLSAEPAGTCRAHLDASARAAAEWRLERAFAAFEAGVAPDL
jgi:adenosine deaminase